MSGWVWLPPMGEIEEKHAKKLYAIPWISEDQVLQKLVSIHKKDVTA